MNNVTHKDGLFTIQTKNSTYSFMSKFGVLIHLYYGEKIDTVSGTEKYFPDYHRSFGVYYEEFYKDYYPSIFPCEVSFYDYGDFRTPSVSIKGADLKYISDFEYQGYEITAEKRKVVGMPYGRNGDNSETLTITLKSRTKDVYCLLNYTVYPDIDVITRNTEIVNKSGEVVRIERCASMLMDFNQSGFNILTLQGIPANERKRHIEPVPYGRYTLSSVYGTTGSFSSPFAILAPSTTDENQGSAYSVNLVYSGNFAIETCLNDYETTRISAGINPEFFLYNLCDGETFYSPEVVMAYSNTGFNGISIANADYTRNYIMPEKFAKQPRPVVINTWEALIFDINEQKLLDFADVAVKAGLDTLVIDDGWFSTRRWDDKGLGDWWVCEDLFPSGLQKFSEQITAKGIGLGIWIEPEMVNPNSELFRTHPEWALGDPRLLSRDQLVLDMTNPEVRDYIFNAFVKAFGGVKLSYIKWDMNRPLAPFRSNYTKDTREVAHRYMLGAYELMERMTKHFDNVLFESCSGGGGRYDLAMLHYTPQIWTSDNTDPFERSYIQAGASYFTPLSAMSCHVTRSFNIGTRLGTSLDFRYNMALNGMLGYEFDLFKLSDEELMQVKDQITEYKRIQDLMLKGDFYRTTTPFDGSIYAYSIVSKDKKHAIFAAHVIRNGRNFPDIYLNIYGLDDEKTYSFDGKQFKGKYLRLNGFRIPNAECSGQSFRYELVALD